MSADMVLRLSSAHDIHRYVQDLGDLQDGICVPAESCREVVGRAALAPAVVPLSRSDGETGAHVGVPGVKDRARFIYALRDNKLEMSVAVLGDGQVGDRARSRVELGQIAAACLSVEDRDDLHGRLSLCRDGRVTGT